MSATKRYQRGSTIWDHLNLIIRWRWTFIIIMSLMAVSSVTYALLAKQWYRSYANILPPPSNTFGLSSFLPGLSMGALGALGGFSDEVNLVATVLESRYIKDEVIREFNWMEVNELTDRKKAYDRYIKKVKWEVNDMGVVSIQVEETSASLAAETVNFIVDKVAKKYNEISVEQAKGQREFVEKRLDQNYADIEKAEKELKEFQEETGVIVLEEQMAASVNSLVEIHKELILAQISYDVLSQTLPKESAEILMAKRKIDAIKKQIKTMNSATNREDHKFLIGTEYAPEIGVKYLRLKRELELQTAILQFLLPQYEQARIVEMQDTSNLYIIDKGIESDKRAKPKRAFIVLAWMFISFFILFGFISFLDWLRRLEDEDKERYDFINTVINNLKPKNFFSTRKIHQE